MNRRQFLPTLAAPVLAQANRPNIVFVLVDDLRWDALGCTGHPHAKTPNVDRIAREGVRFTNAFVTTPLCSPARASFLTGRYVHSHGVTGNGDNAALSHKLITFPRQLHDAGYETAYVCKWHMGTDDSPRSGIDRWVSFRGQGQYNNPELNIDGQRQAHNGYITDLLNQHAVDFLKKPRQKPFCLYLAHKAVHGPFTPADRHKSDYSSMPIQRSANAKDPLSNKPALTRLVDGTPAVQSGGGSGDELIRNQLRCLNAIDDGVGTIFRTLEQSGQLDSTMFVFTSDNGYFWGEHGLGDKRWAFDESIRIPLLVRYPKLARAGAAIAGDALNVDIAPTFLDLAGVKPSAPMHGRSLLPLLRGRSQWRSSFLSEYFAEKNFPRAPGWQAVRGQGWKYVHYTELEGMDELYHLAKDPGEINDLIADRSAARQLSRLKADLARLLKETA